MSYLNYYLQPFFFLFFLCLNIASETFMVCGSKFGMSNYALLGIDFVFPFYWCLYFYFCGFFFNPSSSWGISHNPTQSFIYVFIFTQGSPLGGVQRTTLSFLVYYKAAKKKISFYTSFDLVPFVLLLCLMDFMDPKSLGTTVMLNYDSCSFFLSLNRDENPSVEAFQRCTYLHTQPCQEAYYCLSKFTKKKLSEFWLGREPFVITKQYGSLPCENWDSRFPIASSSGSKDHHQWFVVQI